MPAPGLIARRMWPAVMVLLAACGTSPRASAPGASSTNTAPGSTASTSDVAAVKTAEATIKTALSQAQPALQQAAAKSNQAPYEFVKVAGALTEASGQILGKAAGPHSSDATAFADAIRQLQSDFNQVTVDLAKASSDLAAYGAAANRYNHDLGIG